MVGRAVVVRLSALPLGVGCSMLGAVALSGGWWPCVSVTRPHHCEVAVVAVDRGGERGVLVAPDRHVESMVLVRSSSASICPETWRKLGGGEVGGLPGCCDGRITAESISTRRALWGVSTRTTAVNGWRALQSHRHLRLWFSWTSLR